MATVVIALDGTRVNASDTGGSGSGWGKVNISGPAPVAEAQNAYQNSLAVNVKNTNTGVGNFGGLDYDYSAVGSIDHTAATHPLAFLKIYVADFGALRTDEGVRARIGSSNTLYYYYCLAGTAANRSVFNTYPPQGGYILAAINPNIAAWREGTAPGGAPTLSATDYYAGLAVFTTGGAKSENFAVDAIDTGRGLKLTRGDAGSTEGNFQNFVTSDQDTLANRWGVVFTRAGVIFAIGKLTIGESGTASEFIDTGTDILIFPDGYYGVGDVGVLFDITNASSTVTMSTSRIRGRGSSTTSDTRPDFVVSGTSGTFAMDGTVLGNFRNITFTSVCGVTNADLECQLLTQASANLDNSIIRTNSVTSVACLQDPTFGTSTDLHDVDFIQAGAGHAIELSTAGTYTLTNITFSGYGADASDSAALDITAGTGTYNINYSGTAPTFKKSGTETVNLISTVPVKVTVVDKNNNAIQYVQTSVHLSSDDTEVVNLDTNGSGVASGTLDSTLAPAACYIRARKNTPNSSAQVAVVSAGGTGYTVNDVLTVSGGTGTAAQLKVTGVSGGVITTVDILYGGVYTATPGNPASVTGGTGSSATFTITYTSGTRYRAFSTTGTIASGTGLDTTVVLQNDTIAI